MLGRQPRALSLCKHYAIKEHEIMKRDPSYGRRRASLNVMKDRTEAWMTINADSPQMVEEKKLQAQKEERLLRERVARQKKEREYTIAKHSISSSNSAKPKGFRFTQDSPRFANADSPELMQRKINLAKKEQNEKLRRVKERQREAKAIKEYKRLQLLRKLESGNASPRMKAVLLSPTTKSSSPRSQSASASPRSARSSRREKKSSKTRPLPKSVKQARDSYGNSISPKSAPAFSPKMTKRANLTEVSAKSSRSSGRKKASKFTWNLNTKSRTSVRTRNKSRSSTPRSIRANVRLTNRRSD
mmetsp:Transcript_24199/g.58460  ORF Transcript_24199/g.58460 Transcript_24199/m.58460 type:complete len:301 (+) Transcript_24199:448-1350(+)